MPTLDAQLEQGIPTYFAVADNTKYVVGEPPDVIARSFQTAFDHFAAGKTGPNRNSMALSELIGFAYNSKLDAFLASKPEGKRVIEFVHSFDPLLTDITDAMSLQESDRANPELSVFHQRLSQDLYVVSNDPISSPRRRVAEEFHEIILALLKQGSVGSELIMTLNGDKSQAALMNLFKENNFEVLVPDVSNQSEVEAWDMKGGVDFVALPSDRKKLYYINAKGLAGTEVDGKSVQQRIARVGKYEDFERHYTPNAEEAHQTIRKDVVAFMNNRNKPIDPDISFLNVHITIPTGADYLSPLGRITDPTISRDIMTKLLALK